MKRPIPFAAVAAAAWAACAVQAATGLGGSLVVCPFRLLTGHACPGCGMGRAVVAAMRGDWAASWGHHPLGMLVLAVWTAWLVREGFSRARALRAPCASAGAAAR